MNELELYTRSWGATAVPFGPLSETQWVAIPSQQRAVTLLNQTAALRGVMLLSGGNGMGQSALVGRWVRPLENRLYPPVNLTQATLSSSGLLASLARGLGKRASLRRERNLDELSSYLSEHERQTLVIVLVPIDLNPVGVRIANLAGENQSAVDFLERRVATLARSSHSRGATLALQ